MTLKPVPQFGRPPKPEASFQGIALNVELPDEVLRLLANQHAAIQALSETVGQLASQQQATTQLLMRLVQNPPVPQVKVGSKRMKRTPVRDENNQILYVIDEEF